MTDEDIRLIVACNKAHNKGLVTGMQIGLLVAGMVAMAVALMS